MASPSTELSALLACGIMVTLLSSLEISRLIDRNQQYLIDELEPKIQRKRRPSERHDWCAR